MSHTEAAAAAAAGGGDADTADEADKDRVFIAMDVNG